MSSHIRARKHKANQLATLVTLAFPAAAMAQEAVVLPEVKVEAQADAPYKADKTANPKYTQPLVDTPQTITVIKKELIEEQGATTLADAVRNSPGVGTFFLGENGNTNTGDAIYMRGFDASNAIFVDNVRDTGAYSRDMFNVEQVEILKGPAGTDTGRGSPTGSINMVTKQANMEDAFSASAMYGSASQKRATMDWNKVINSADGVAFRLNLMKQDGGVPGRDEVENHRTGVAASLAYGLGKDARVFLDYLHQEQRDVPDGGVFTIGLPGYSSPDATRPYISGAPKVDSKNFYGLSSDYNDVDTDRLTLRVERDISPDVKIQNTTRYGRTGQNYLLTSYLGSAANLATPSPTDYSTWTIKRSNPTIKDQVNEIITNQTYVTAKLRSGSVEHTLFGGFELTQEKQNNGGYLTSGTLPDASVYNPNPNDGSGTWTKAPNSSLDSAGKTNTVSAYLFDTIKFSERWSVNGGLRVDRYSTDYDCGSILRNGSWSCTNAAATGTTVRQQSFSTSGTLTNWKLAGIYKPTENSSVYALYATSQQPPGGNNFSLSGNSNSADNPSFDPQKTKTTELGSKWDVLNKRLALTAAIYRTEIENNIEQDVTSGSYFQTGKKSVEGIELGAAGAITENWGVSAGYSHMNTKVDSGAVVTNSGDNVLAYTPKDSFTAWTTYKFKGGLSVGGGARYVSSLLRGTDGAVGTPAYADSYWVFDAMATYAVSKNVDLRLNVYNLFDEEYVAAINKSGYRYTPGLPRYATVTATFRF